MKPSQNHRLAKVAVIVVGICALGFLGILAAAYAYDESTNRANAKQYEEYASKITVGMQKSEVITRIGPPVAVNQGKDNEELWSWQSHHRWEHRLIYGLVGRPAYHGGPYLQLSFDTSGRVATVDTSRMWR